MFEAWQTCVKKQSRLLSLVETTKWKWKSTRVTIMLDLMSNALWMAFFACSGFGTFFPIRLCYLWICNKMMLLAIDICNGAKWYNDPVSLSSDMDEISVVFESIMESCAFGENSCEFEDEKKVWRWKETLSGSTISSSIFDKLVT